MNSQKTRQSSLVRWHSVRSRIRRLIDRVGVGPNRRGSVLILILGGLALLSVATVAYVALGRSDRNRSTQLVRRSDDDQFVRYFRDYLADVIAADVFDTVPEPSLDGSAGTTLLREAWDYPSTDYSRRSVTLQAGEKFSPTGEGTDPWLADTMPTWLDWQVTTAGENFWFANRRDWGHISNVSPDGRFVNLYNLRLDFEAKPGIRNGEMSDELTLFADDGRTATTALDFGGQSELDTPAHWAGRQAHAFRPMKETVYDPNDPEYLFYQWEDADGDGFADSRWIELVDASDSNDVRWMYPRPDDTRYFLATRIVDLSSLANISTAASFRKSPQLEVPAGLFPSDVDLRRLLSQQDVWNNIQFGAYDKLPGPEDNGVQDYRGVDEPLSYEAGELAFDSIVTTLVNGAIPETQDLPFNLDTIAANFRSVYYEVYGGRGPEGGFNRSNAFDVRSRYGVGHADLLELLTYRGVNDPEVDSRLERLLGARLTSDPYFSPLRSNRSLEWERTKFDVDPDDGTPDAGAFFWQESDLRQRLTTLSGARPLTASTVGGSVSMLSAATDLRLNATGILREATTGTGTIVNGVSPANELFKGYARGLLPYAEDPMAWDPDPRHWTGAYGYNPLLALRMSAHLAVNMLDNYDTDNDPTLTTLIVASDYQDVDTPENDLEHPWDRLLLDDSRLPTSSELSSIPYAEPEALNVYGIEVQPFVTGAFSFIMYSDDGMGEGGQSGVLPRPGDPPIPLELKGTVAASNSEFMMEVIAFQLHNPFNETVYLTDPIAGHGADLADVAATDPLQNRTAQQYYDYYIEYGGANYKIVDRNRDGTNKGVTLRPGQTRNFYALSQDYDQIVSRWSSGTADDLISWLRQQFAVDNSPPIRISQTDVRTGAFINTFPVPGIVELHSTDDAQNVEVKLWRVLRSEAHNDRPMDVGDTMPDNDPDNDMLVDRFRDPNPMPPSLKRRLAETDMIIEGTDYTQDGQGFYSLTLYAALGRPNLPGGGGVEEYSVPPYCVEVKYGSSRNWERTDDHSNLSRLTKADFEGGSEGFHDTWTDLLADQTGSAMHREAMRDSPDSRSISAIGTNQVGESFEDITTEIPLDNRRFTRQLAGANLSTLRVADLLMPLALGPIQDTRGASNPQDDDWLTLSEALAMAFYYYDPLDGQLLSSVLSGVVVPPIFGNEYGLGSAKKRAVDRGHLTLDAFVPYSNGDASPEFDPAQDVRLGIGAPAALNVLNVFSTLEPSLEGPASSPDFGSLARSTFGTINVNTAPVSILRLLPMLSPAAEAGDWWGTSGGMSGLDTSADIAATIAAYRDKQKVLLRRTSGGALQSPSYVTMRDDPSDATPDNLLDAKVRADRTGVVAIREEPGFRSVGELLAVRIHDAGGGGSADISHSMDVLARDLVALKREGVESVMYQTTAGPGGPIASGEEPDDLVDNYDEQLAVYNAIANSVSVRSDYYAVWFVVSGFKRGDVEGLGPDEPMVPSINRRFLMVVDRSNVVREGDKPRIVMFKELPL